MIPYTHAALIGLILALVLVGFEALLSPGYLDAPAMTLLSRALAELVWCEIVVILIVFFSNRTRKKRLSKKQE